MKYCILPLTNDPRQVMTLDLTIDGEGFHARIEVRYLPAPGCWVISVWDEAAGELLINQIPLICSYGFVNDLAPALRPARQHPQLRPRDPDRQHSASGETRLGAVSCSDRYSGFHAGSL